MQAQDAELEGLLLPKDRWTPFEAAVLIPADPRYATLLMVTTALTFLVIFLPLSLLLIFAGVPDMIVLAISSIGVSLAGLSLWLGHRWAIALGYGVGELDLLSQTGVWWQKRTAMPYSRIQHVTLSQGPMERRYGLACIKCFSAGSGNAEIEIRGLPIDDAEALRGHLLARAGVTEL